jgi:hypothetical protein
VVGGKIAKKMHAMHDASFSTTLGQKSLFFLAKTSSNYKVTVYLFKSNYTERQATNKTE